MKIGFVYPHWNIPDPPGGHVDALAVLVHEITRRLARRHEVLVYPRQGRGQRVEAEHEGVRFRRVPVGVDRALSALKLLDRLGLRRRSRPFHSSSLYYAFYARRVARDLSERGCEVVHLFTCWSFLPVLRAANPQARIVLHLQDHGAVQRDRALTERCLSLADCIVGCSEYVTGQVRERFPRLADRCRSVCNGVDLDRFGRPSAADAAQPPEAGRVLFVGRVSPEKGVHVLLDAFAALASRLPQARLDLVGPRSVAPKQFVDPLDEDPHFTSLRGFYRDPASYFAYLERKLDGDLARRVRFLGEVPHSELPELYRRAELFVFPSLWHEPFGIPVVEAMAAGRPVVATRGGAFTELVDDGRTGLLVERGDAEGLAEAIAGLLSDADLRVAMGEAGRKRAGERYGWDAMVDRLESIYAA